MKLPPWILGAAALVPIAGAAIGANINTTPVGSVDDVTQTVPQQQLNVARIEPYTSQPRLPDHYAMKTPEGRIEIAELAMRGRYAARRPAPVYHDIEPDSYWRETEYSEPASRTAQPAVAKASPRSENQPEPEYVQLAVVQKVRNHAKSMDVEAQLALQ